MSTDGAELEEVWVGVLVASPVPQRFNLPDFVDEVTMVARTGFQSGDESFLVADGPVFWKAG